jgi:hypothetical protein
MVPRSRKWNCGVDLLLCRGSALFQSTARAELLEATLADAKDLLDKNPQCLDILVTQDGTKNGIVVGWITNVMLLNAATI